jgi:hypothetical protein
MAPSRRTRRAPTPSRKVRPPPAEAAPTAQLRRIVPIEAEDPHSHIVCRVCGRIQPVELSELDRHLLTELAALRPDGWSVDRIAFSLTGACRRCREGPGTP